MIFKEQLENRSDYNRAALKETFDVLNSIVNPKGGKIASDSAKSGLYEILDSLGVTGYEFNSESEDLQVDFEEALKKNEILFRRISLKDNWWKSASGPILATANDGRFVALIPAYNGYRWTNPQTGKQEQFSRKANKCIKDDAFCFYKTLPSRALKFKDLAKFMVHTLNLSDGVYVFIACVAVCLLGMFTPYVNKQIFDELIPTGSSGDIFPIAGLLIGASIGSIMFGVTRSMVLMRVKDKIDANLQAAIMARTYSLPAPFFKDYSPGDLSNRVMSISNLCRLMNDMTMSSILTILFSVVYFYQIFVYAKALMVLCIGLMVLNIAVLCLISYFQAKHNNKYMQIDSKLKGVVYSLFSGIQKIKTSGAEVRAFHRWAKTYKDSAVMQYQPRLILKISKALTSLCAIAGTGLIYYFTIKNNISLSDFIAFSSAFGMVSVAIASFSDILPSFTQLSPLLRLAKPILETEPETEDSSTIVKSLSGSIEVTNLTFRYSQETPYIFNGLSLKIRPGEFVALVGGSGCGKSTLIRLLLGFEKPESGTIFYDQYNIDKVNKQSLRRCVGTCLQDGRLFPGDIFANITVTAPWSTMGDAWEASRIAGFDTDVKDMPMNMYTVVSEGGGGLSGGQKQRLLIARSVINKPSVLFFDEATSALDNIKQKIVSENIEKMGCTRISIAHRLSTIKNCDRIIVLDKGKVSEEGTFNELIEKKGVFYELSKRQL